MTRTTAPPAPSEPASGGAPPSSARHERIRVSGSQVAASVLASTSAAVVASFFGVAGTIVGAALVSIVATIGTAAYGLGIRRTTARLQQVQALRLGRPAGSGGRTGSSTAVGAPGDLVEREATAGTPGAGVTPTGDERSPSSASATTAPADGGWLARLVHHRFRLAAGVGLVLVLSLGAVSLIEVVTDGPLSGGAGGGRTSIGALFDGGQASDGQGDDGSGTADGHGTTTTAPSQGPVEPAPEPDAAEPPASTGAGEVATTTTEPSPSSTTTSTTAPPSSSTTTPPTTAAPPPPAAAAPTAAG